MSFSIIRRAPSYGRTFLQTCMVALLALLLCAAGPARPVERMKPSLERDAERLGKKIRGYEQTEQNRPADELSTEEEENRRSAIQTYRTLLNRKDSLSPRTYEEAMFSLGTLLFEDSMAHYRASMKHYEQDYERFKRGQTANEPGLPRYDFQASREVYQELLKTFPHSLHRAEVLYNMAYSYDEEGRLDEAMALYDELVRSAPHEKYAPEVYMRLGENYFEMNEFPKAIQCYEKIIEQGDTPLYEKALFKIGWSYYAEEQFPQAKSAFAKLLDLFGPGSGKKKGDLYKESLEIMAKSFSETGGAQALGDFLKNRNYPEYGLPLFIQLGGLYKETSRYKDAIDTYTRVLLQYPQSPDAPLVEGSLVECLMTEHRNEEAGQHVESMIARYGRGSPWEGANPDADARKRVDEYLRDALTQQILLHHDQARKTAKPEEYATAVRLYQKYLSYFPQDEKSYEMRFLLAECLFEMHQYEKAALEYEKVSKILEYQSYREKAASKRIQSLEALRAQGLGSPEDLLMAYRDYVELNPQSEKTPPLIFKQGEILFNAARYNEAAGIFESIISRYPGDPNYYTKAWMLVLECYFEGKDYPGLEQKAEVIQQRQVPLDPKQRARMLHLLHLAQFEQARAFENAGDFKGAAQGYVRLSKDAPQIAIAPDALYNAALCYQRAGQIEDTVQSFESLAYNYPHSKYAKEAVLFLVPYYEQKEQWDKVVMYLDALYSQEQSSIVAKESLYRVGKRLYKSGNMPRAFAIFSAYGARYPNDYKRRLEIQFLEAQFNERKGNTAGARQKYSLLLKDFDTYKRAEPSLAVDPVHLAKARFALLEDDFKEYKAIELVEPLQKNLKKKESLQDRLISGYVETMRYGIPEISISSAYRIAQAYEDFSACLLKSEIPRGLTEEERRIYGELLNQKALPYQQKARESYKITVEKAKEKGIFSPWAIKAYSHLSAFDPGHYPQLLEEGLIGDEKLHFPWSLIERIDRDQARGFSSWKTKRLQKRLNKAILPIREGIIHTTAQPPPTDESIALLTHMVNKEPALYEVHYNLGVLYEIRGESDKAASEYNAALSNNPTLGSAHLNLAVLYFNKGDYGDAEKYFAELSQILPHDAEAPYLQGICLEKMSKYSEAVNALLLATTRKDAFLDPYVELVRINHILGKKEEAAKNFRHVLDNPEADAGNLRKLGYVLIQTEMPEMALSVYAKILNSGQGGYEDWNNQGIALLHLGKLTEAKRCFVKATEIEPKRPEGYNNLGIVAFRLQQLKEAAVFFEKATNADPQFAPALLNEGMLYGSWLEDMEKARTCFREYIDKGGTAHASLIKTWLAYRPGEQEGQASW